ncbi:glycosyltransferase [uncultured Sphingomonas sp.]|uniref:glycosyltransferase n=1 Tax=uncultured Sphingomonas sp. TaxID=158754 RepID=UPI0035CA1E6D
MRKIVLTTIGTLGDLHPFIAVALALKARGFRPVLAVPDDHIRKVKRAGLEAVAVLPAFDTIRERLGMSESEAVRRMMNDQRYMLEQAVLPSLSACAHTLDALTGDADAIVASTMVLAAPIIAEKRGIPLVSVMLQPMAMVSALDPPKTPDFWMMRQRPASKIGERWNLLMYAGFRQILHRLYADQLDVVRIEHGLRPRGAMRMLEAGREALLTIGCYSPVFAPLPRDAPQNARVVGFPIFDSANGGSCALDPALEAFLRAGPPPIVFTLGSFAVYAAGDFYTEAAEVARRLGQRAIMLTGERETVAADRDVFACAYAPHSHLFHRCSVVVHHGGIGTTGQALCAGKPQLVVPHMGDQNDNGHRIARAGIGLVLRAKHFSARRATILIEDLLRDPSRRERAARIGETIAQENGAQTAARAIEQALGRGRRMVGQSKPIPLPA